MQRSHRRQSLVDSPESGFTLIEMTIALAVIGIVTAAVTTFFTRSMAVVNQQRGNQVAIQLADDAIERARALKGSSVLTGRDQASVQTQFTTAVNKVRDLMADQQLVWDTTAAAGAGATASLPTAANTVKVNGVDYRQQWYVGACWQPRNGGECTATTNTVGYYRIVVAVTWADKSCAGGACSYATSTLVSSAAKDPVFTANRGALAPTVTNPGNITTDVTVAISRVLVSTGGAPPVTWSATGLPSTITVSSNGTLSGTPTAAGTYLVTVTATDGFNKAGTAAFTLTVNPLPVLTDPGQQTTTSGTAVSLTVPLTGGTGPMTWTAVGLPAGLTINPTTGAITGTAGPAAPTTQVTVTVTDVHQKTSSIRFGWRIQ